MSRPDEIVDRAARGLSRRLATRATRRGFLAGIAAGAFAVVGARPAEARIAGVRGANKTKEGWFGFCGHTWTTGSCPSPFLLPRIDARGFPLRPSDGRPVDNLGRLIDGLGRPVNGRGELLTSPDGTPLPPAPRTRICQDWVPERHPGITPVVEGAWYRCCNNQIRKLTDCCSTSRIRINGDASLVGYCRPGRRVFCVMYYDTGVPC